MARSASPRQREREGRPSIARVDDAVIERGDLEPLSGHDRRPPLRIEGVGRNEDALVLNAAVGALGDLSERFRLLNDVSERRGVSAERGQGENAHRDEEFRPTHGPTIAKLGGAGSRTT